VRAGVPADLDDIACRALAASPRRNSTPLRTPAEVAAARAGGVNGASATTTALPATALDTDGDAPGRFAAPAEPSRAARAVRAVSGVVLAAGLALAAWQLLVAVVDRDEATVRRNRPAPPSTAAPLVPSGRELSIVRVTDFDPKPGNGEEHPEQLQYAVDKNPATAWHTMSYRNRPNLGGTKDGVGLLIDLGSPQRVTSVTLQLEGRGTAVELRAGGESPAKASDLPVVASERDAGPLVTMVIDGGTEVRFVLVWLTSLPSGDSDKEYRGGIAEVTVRG
jgi:putative peptidoglycan lipid II flippase